MKRVIVTCLVGLIFMLRVLYLDYVSENKRGRNRDPLPRSAVGKNDQPHSTTTSTSSARFSSPIKIQNCLPNAFVYPNQAGTTSRTVVVFFHVPKSGGTTMKDCMTKIYNESDGKPPEVLASRTVSKITERLLSNASSVRESYMGESAIGICDHVKTRPCAYITLLRDPYDRIISDYLFCRSGRGLHKLPCNGTIEEYTIASGSQVFRQLTSRLSCHLLEGTTEWRCAPRKERGYGGNYPSAKVSDAALQYILNNLERIFIVIGLTEEFATSLKLFQLAFQEISFYDECNTVHSNVGSYGNGTINEKKERDEVQLSYRQKLQRNNEVGRALYEDLQIYNKAKEIFLIQTRNVNHE